MPWEDKIYVKMCLTLLNEIHATAESPPFFKQNLTWDIEDWPPALLPLEPEKGSYDVLPPGVPRPALIVRRGCIVLPTIDLVNRFLYGRQVPFMYSRIVDRFLYGRQTYPPRSLRSAYYYSEHKNHHGHADRI